LLLHANGHQVMLWGPFADYIEEMKAIRMNPKFLKGIALPADLQLTANMGEAVQEADLVVMASPTQFARKTLVGLAALELPKPCRVLNVAKGIEVGSIKRLSEIASEVLGDRAVYGVLSGPSH